MSTGAALADDKLQRPSGIGRRKTGRRGVPISIRVPVGVLQRADERAKEDGYEVSEVVAQLLTAYGWTNPATGKYDFMPGQNAMAQIGFSSLYGELGAKATVSRRYRLASQEVLDAALKRATAEVGESLAAEYGGRVTGLLPLMTVLRTFLDAYAAGTLKITPRPSIVKIKY